MAEEARRNRAVLSKANPKDREPYLDKLIKRRDEGTMAQFVERHAPSSCMN
jgi:hypothetical protein